MDSNTSFIFRRPDLATRLVDDMMGRGPFHYGSGLFLAAPRRTGNSTFMRDDLRPALKDQGVLTTYVDLWEDKQRDPALLIGDAVKTTLRSLDGWGVKTLRKAGLAAELADDARALRQRNWEEYDGEFSSLSALQRAVLGRLVQLGPRLVPFAAASLSAYGEELGRLVTTSEAQGALEGLRTLNIVWRNGRSAYALEDQAMADWFIARYGKR
jgi:hypothetical protein